VRLTETTVDRKLTGNPLEEHSPSFSSRLADSLELSLLAETKTEELATLKVEWSHSLSKESRDWN